MVNLVQRRIVVGKMVGVAIVLSILAVEHRSTQARIEECLVRGYRVETCEQVLYP
jgi:hypothetical protein